MRPVGIAEGSQSQDNTHHRNINADAMLLFGGDGQIIKACFDVAVLIDPRCRRCEYRRHSRPGTLMASLMRPARTRRLAPAIAREIISVSVGRSCSPGVRYRYHRRSLIPSPRVLGAYYVRRWGDTFTTVGQDIAPDTDLACIKSAAQTSTPLLT